MSVPEDKAAANEGRAKDAAEQPEPGCPSVSAVNTQSIIGSHNGFLDDDVLAMFEANAISEQLAVTRDDEITKMVRRP